MSYDTDELLYEMRGKKGIPSLEKIAKQVAQEAKKKKEQQVLVQKQIAGKKVDPEALLEAGGVKLDKIKEKKKVALIKRDAAGDYKKEENIRRLFAASLLKKKEIFDNSAELEETFNTFSNSGREDRKQFVYLITNSLNRKQIKKFMKKLVKNPDDDSMELFDKFVKKHKKTIKFAEEARAEMEEELAGEAANVAYKRMMDFIAAKKMGVPFAERRKAIVLNEKGEAIVEEEVVVPAKVMKRKADLTCINDYKIRLWIPGYTDTWLAAAPGEELDKSFVIPNKIMTADDRAFFKANKNFDLLLCSSYSNLNRQVGNVFIAYDDKKKEHHFLVGHRIKSRGGPIFTIQDEKIFQDERNYFNRMKKSLRDLIREFLATPMTNNEVRITASEIFRKQLVNTLLPLIKKIKPSYNLLPTSEEVIGFDRNAQILAEKGTIEDYARVYARIIGPFANEDFRVYVADILTKIAKGIYTIDTLADIPTDLLFVEIFRNPRIKPRTLATGRVFDPRVVITETSDALTNEYTTMLGALVYKAFNPYAGSLAAKVITPALKPEEFVLDMGEVCSQKGIPAHRRVYYVDKDDGVLYCFDVIEILSRFDKKDIINPFTRKEFSPEFITEVSKVNLDAITKELFGEDEEEIVEKEDEKKEKVVIEMPIDKKIDKEDRSIYIRALVATIMDDETGLFQDDTVDAKDKCEYCKDVIENPIFKTIIKYGEDSEVFGFCDVKCFTDWDEPSDEEDDDDDDEEESGEYFDAEY